MNEAPKPGMPPIQKIDPATLAKMLSQMGGGDKVTLGLKPIFDRINWISQEMERTHATIRVLAEHRQNHFTEMQYLDKLREVFNFSLQQHHDTESELKTK